MTRGLDPSLASQYTAQSLSPIALIELFFDSGTLRFWSGLNDLFYGGNTFTGAGNILKITDYNETQSLQARGINFILSGISSSIIALALTESYQGRVGKLFIGALNDSGALIGTPYQLFYGLMDNLQITEQGDTCNVSVSLENRLVILKTKKERRFTPEDQKFEIGKAWMVNEGTDVTIIATGHMVWRAIEAGEMLVSWELMPKLLISTPLNL